MDSTYQEDIMTYNTKVPIWTIHFNGEGLISDDWKMWHNGYNRDELKNYFNTVIPAMLKNQTLREMAMPLVPQSPAVEHFECAMLNQFDTRFFYPIAISWWSDLAGLIEQTIDIPLAVIDSIVHGTCQILLYNNREQWGHSFWKNIIDIICKRYPTLNLTHFTVMCNNPDIAEIDSIPLITNQTIKQDSSHHTSHEHMRGAIKHKILNPVPNQINHDGARAWKFVCLLRRPTAVRWALSAELMKYKIEGECLMSMSCDMQLIEQNGPLFKNLGDGYYDYMRQNFWVDRQCVLTGYDDVHLKYNKSAALLTKYDKHYPFWIENDTNPLTNPITDPDIWKYTDTYLHVVSETFVTRNEGVCLSEKIFKPIWYMQPFIPIGTAHTLKALRNLGYKTFDTWIDESYDSIEDDTERFYAAVNSIKSFVDQDKSTLDRIMQEMLPTLEHNTTIIDRNNSNIYDQLRNDLNSRLRRNNL
jgi:hypothetical protein